MDKIKLSDLLAAKFLECVKEGNGFKPVYYPHIPETRQAKAEKNFVDYKYKNETMIMLFDTSLFERGKNGLVFTDKAVYFKDTFGDARVCKYSDWRRDRDDLGEIFGITKDNAFFFASFLNNLMNEISIMLEYEVETEGETSVETEAEEEGETSVETAAEAEEEVSSETVAEAVTENLKEAVAEEVKETVTEDVKGSSEESEEDSKEEDSKDDDDEEDDSDEDDTDDEESDEDSDDEAKDKSGKKKKGGSGSSLEALLGVADILMDVFEDPT